MDLLKYYGFDWLGMLCGVVGIWRLGNKKRSGFIFNMMAAVAGLVFSILANSVAYIIVNTLIFCLNLRGYVKWKREEVNS